MIRSTIATAVGIGALAIPGVGPFIAAGPILAALSGAPIGAAAGGIAGGLVGLGIPELEAKRYEGKVKEGNILLSVHTENPKSARPDAATAKPLGEFVFTGEWENRYLSC